MSDLVPVQVSYFSNSIDLIQYCGIRDNSTKEHGLSHLSNIFKTDELFNNDAKITRVQIANIYLSNKSSY